MAIITVTEFIKPNVLSYLLTLRTLSLYQNPPSSETLLCSLSHIRAGPRQGFGAGIPQLAVLSISNASVASHRTHELPSRDGGWCLVPAMDATLPPTKRSEISFADCLCWFVHVYEVCTYCDDSDLMAFSFHSTPYIPYHIHSSFPLNISPPIHHSRGNLHRLAQSESRLLNAS